MGLREWLSRRLGRRIGGQSLTVAPSRQSSPRGWVPVESSWLVETLYDSGTLWIRFDSGVICQYEGVSPQMYQSLLAAPSKGKWLHANIVKRRWPYKIL